MSYLGGKQQPPLNRSRHPPRYGPQQIYHNQYERPPDPGVPLTQPGGRYNVPLSAQPRGYGPPPGAGDGQPLQYMPPPRPYQQPMHEMAKQNLELPSVPGYPGPHQHHQAPVLRPGAPLVTGAPGYSAHQMMAGPRPPAPAPGYPPGGHAISMPPPPAPHTAAAFSMAGGLPPGQAPPMMMFFSPGQVPPGGQGHPGVRQGPTAYMPTPPVYSTQPPYQQQLTVQPPQGLYVQAQPQPAPGGQPAPPQIWGPPPPAQMSLPPPMEPLQARRPQEQLYAPPVPPPAPVQHHASHRIPIINPETHEEVAVSGNSAQTPSGVPETAWRPLGNGVSTLPRSGRQHSSASVSELGEPDNRRGPRARSSASYSECPLPGEGVPEWAPAPALAPQSVPGRFQTPTANGLSTHSPDVIRRQVMNYASPASTVRQSEWNPARAPGWCPPVPPSRPSDGHYSLPASLPDLVPVPSVPPGLPPPDSALQYSQAAPRPEGAEMGLQYGQGVPLAVSARLEGPEAARQQFAQGVPPPIVDSLPKESESEREPAVPDATSVTSESAEPAGVIPGRPEAVTAEPASSAEVEPGECVPPQQLESSAVQEEPVEGSAEFETAEEAAAEPSLPEAVTVAATELERLAVSAADEAPAAAPPLEPAPESVSPALDSDQPAESTEEVPAASEEVVKSPVTAVVVNGSQSHSSVVSDKPYAPVAPIEQETPHVNGQNGGESAADENGVKECLPAEPQEPSPEPEEPKETAVVTAELQEATDESKDTPSEVTTESPSEQSPEPTPAVTPPSEDTPADSPARGTPASTPADTPSLGTPVGTPSGTPAASRQGSPPPVNGTAGRPAPPATEPPPRHLAAKGDGRPTPPAPAPSHAAKKHYGRSELLALQHAPLSQQRPAALPDLPSVVRRAGATTDQRAAALKPRPIGPGEFASGFKPAVMGPPGKYRGRSSQGGVGGGGGGGRRDGPLQSPAPPVRRIEISRDVKLHTTENAWKPGAAKPGAESAEDSADAEAQLVARLKGILNKITPSNIEKHIENIRQLEFNTDERLGKMINVLFDKAVNEPAYASQYAAVCLAMTKPPAGSEDESKKAMSMFRKLLLTQCQREFEKDKSLELNLGERQREIEAQTDPVERRAKERALEEAQRQGRLRSNGNIRFIGELYKLSMLTDRIMQQCITKLLKDRHEDSYECMCKLVSTIGQKLEVAEKKQGRDLGKMFAEFERLSVDKKLSSRIRFMLRDLIELRANHWVPTRTTAQPRPMTIEEVHEQARLAEAKQQAALAQAEDRRRSERRRGGGGRDAPRPGGDGWSTVGRNSRYDASRMMSAVSATAAAPPPAQLKLGPGGGSGWGLGAKGASPRRASPATTPGSGANRFQALRAEARSRSRGGSAERSGSRNSSADRAPPPPAAAASRLKGPADADADYLKRQARAIVGEFLENGDEESAIVDCEGHLHDSTLADFVTQSLEAFVDARSARERQAAGRLHALLLQRGLLPVAAYVSGARQLLDVSADLATDVPAVWTNLAQLMTPPLLAPGAGLSLSALAAAAYGCVQDGGGVKLTVALLRQLRAEDEQRARELVPAGFNWQRLLGDREPLAVLKEADLECLVSGDPSPLPADRAPPVPGLRALLDAIRSDVPLARWLELNCPQPEKRQHPSFVADLVAAVCFDALIAESGALRVASERIERYCDLLRPVLEPAERQEAAVRAAADLVRHLDCSTDVLEQLLERLLTLRLVSEPALRHWREAVGGDPIVPPLRFLQP